MTKTTTEIIARALEPEWWRVIDQDLAEGFRLGRPHKEMRALTLRYAEIAIKTLVNNIGVKMSSAALTEMDSLPFSSGLEDDLKQMEEILKAALLASIPENRKKK